MCLLLAVTLAIALYAPTLGYGFVGYDDTWLVRDNWILQQPSWASVHTIFFDLDPGRRFVLGSEYLPVRDLSIMFDVSVWGSWLPGFHITNLVLYIASLALWFMALVELGLNRKVVGTAILLWALHPTHAESVAWLAERKGLLALALCGVTAVAYLKFRMGRSWAWLVAAAVAAALAVWSKAPAAFAIAALAAFELIAPASRTSWRRSIIGLTAIGAIAAAAFVPVVMVASKTSVIGEQTTSFGRGTAVFGGHGFYIQLATMVQPNSVSYPVSNGGPNPFQIAVGVAALVLLVGVAVMPRGNRFSPSVEVRAGALVWLFGWLPVSHAIIPIRTVFAADRYLLFASLGLLLLVASGVCRIGNVRVRRALLVTVVFASALRTWDAQSNWRNAETLWQRAVMTNPDDDTARTMYSEAVANAGDGTRAIAIVDEGLRETRDPRLVMRRALLELQYGSRDRGLDLMREAADRGEYRAMANLALLLLNAGETADALRWARASVQSSPLYASGQRTLGKIALASGELHEALAAFERAYALEPQRCNNRFNLALALIATHDAPKARAHLEACVDDPLLGPRARALLQRL